MYYSRGIANILAGPDAGREITTRCISAVQRDA